MRPTKRFCGAIFCVTIMAAAGLAMGEQAPTTKPSSPHQGAEPEQVFFLIYVLDVDEISGQEQSFTVNAHLRLRWKDERLARSEPAPRSLPLGEVWHPRILLANRRSGMRSFLPEVVEVQSDGTVIYRQQYIGPLSQRFNLSNFPLDKQSFSIQFATPGYRPDDLKFVPDTLVGAEHLVGGGFARQLSLPDWKITGYAARVKPYDVTDTVQVAGFALDFTAERDFGYYLWQVVVPLVLIVMMSWAPLWVDPAKIELQFGIASSAVLTLIAYRFLLANLLPKLPYLTRMDYLALAGTVLVFVAFLQVVLTAFLTKSNRGQAAAGISRWCRALFPAAFAAAAAWALFL